MRPTHNSKETAYGFKAGASAKPDSTKDLPLAAAFGMDTKQSQSDGRCETRKPKRPECPKSIGKQTPMITQSRTAGRHCAGHVLTSVSRSTLQRSTVRTEYAAQAGARPPRRSKPSKLVVTKPEPVPQAPCMTHGSNKVRTVRNFALARTIPKHLREVPGEIGLACHSGVAAARLSI